MDWEAVRGQSPLQSNGFDCGVFTCTTAEFISRGVYPNYTEADLSLVRKRLIAEIIAGEIGIE